ncbi:MAG TPA: LysM peptidoglycan-binding domain-containing protein [Chthoniobacteraceae bacterium]|jgi:hypothetical protein|nr:LysM peptidoglycan-binding domain-containing protein [Chthoniobacteraceae bacterium]
MLKQFMFFFAAAALLSAGARASTDLEQEYVQVRKIALKDPKVRDAYEKAAERLDDKIIEIDPALKPIVDRERARQPFYPETQPVVRVTRVEPRATAAAAGPVSAGEHIVVKGETLSSIAGHYRVKVAALERANHIANDRKLRVGQKLAIPGATSDITEQPAAGTAPRPAVRATPKPSPEDDDFWDKVKKDL